MKPGAKIGNVIVPDGRIGNLLYDIPMFKKLSEDEREELGGAMMEEKFEAGAVVFKQNDVADKLYVVTKGRAIVIFEDRKTGKKVEVGEISEGDYFGEAALLKGESKRGASIYADRAIEVLSITKQDYNTLLGSRSNMRRLDFVKRRVGVLSAEDDNLTAVTVTDEGARGIKVTKDSTKKLLFATIRTNALFEKLEDDQIKEVIDNVYQQCPKQGDTLMKQGEIGGHVYFIESGTFEILVAKGEGEAKRVNTIEGPCVTGELAMLHNAPRNATVRAITDSVTWKIDRYTFRRVIRQLGESQMRGILNFLSKVELLAPLTNLERTKVAEACDEITLEGGQVVCREGDEGDSMYIIKSGQVLVTKGGEEVARNSVGEYFGEKALMEKVPRAATVTCAMDSTFVKLDVAAFHLLLGPLDEILVKRAQSYNVPDLEKKPEDAEHAKVQWTNLTILGTLGRGSFGHVQLVKDSTTDKCYALKGVSKQQIVQTGQKSHILAEKTTMEHLHNPFVIRLYNTYKDRDLLYFLLEPVMGGELFMRLREVMAFKEDVARFYAANVVSCFAYLHSKDIIYRDLKPENLLIAGDGYLKVVDFGFAKTILDKTYTLCGTPEYLAPEIIGNIGHGKGVDWWSVGILIYEMLASITPFYDQDQNKMYERIVKERVKIPVHFSPEAKSIIMSLLQKKKSARLGVIAGEAKGVMDHPWFAGLDWGQLYKKTYVAPWKPKLAGPEDMTMFEDEEYDEEPDPIEPYQDDGTNWDIGF